MEFLASIDWTFLEVFFDKHGKFVAGGVAFLVAIISLAVAIYRYRHANTIERILGKGASKVNEDQEFIRKGKAALEQAAEALKQQEKKILQREQKLENVRSGFVGKEHELWCMHPPRKPPGYDDRIRRQRHKPIIMVANLKGGVGKTTLTANLAAHFSKAGKRVLLVDVDYQGSLSNMMLSADGVEEVSHGVNKLLLPGAGAEAFAGANHKFTTVLQMSSIVTARYELASLENRLMIEYLLQEDEDDGRYRLANVLLAEEVAKTYDIAFIDAPPRLTAGAINAFCASTHLLVPTVYDLLSAEAVGTFLNGAKVLQASLNPRIDLLGVVGMLTSQQNQLVAREENAKRVAMAQVAQTWSSTHHFFVRHIPRKAAIAAAAGEHVAYHCDSTVSDWFDELGKDIASRLGWDNTAQRNTPKHNVMPIQPRETHQLSNERQMVRQ
jgi:cellulose biosynthesis protein BcsQ